MFQNYIVLGTITRNIEQKYLQSGTAVADFGIAVNEKRKDGNGNVIEETMFIDCVTFGRTAEVAAEYLGKGSSVLLQGKLRYETWEDKNGGGKRSKHKFVIERLQMLPPGKSRETPRRDVQQNAPQDEYQPEYQPGQADVPF